MALLANSGAMITKYDDNYPAVATQRVSPHGTVTKLGFYPRGTNDRMTVVVGDADSELAGGLWSQVGQVWTPATGVVPFGLLGGTNSFAAAVNNRGLIVGRADTGDPDPMWGRRHHAVVRTLSSPVLHDLGTLGGPSSTASAVNDAGVIAGSADNAAGQQHAVVWVKGKKIRDLGTLPGGTSSWATAVTKDGVVYGQSARGNYWHAFRWTAKTGMRDLGGAASTFVYLTAVNPITGEAVGQLSTATGEQVAFRWTVRHGLQRLPTAPGGFSPIADQIDARGDIAGTYAIQDPELDMRAFVWTPRLGLQTLPDLGSGAQPMTINDRGEIGGRAGSPDGWHAVLWTLPRR